MTRFLSRLAASCVALIAFASAQTIQAQEVRAVMLPSCPTSTGPDVAPGAEALPAILGPVLASFTGSLVDSGIAALKKVVNPDAQTMNGSFLQEGLYLWEAPRAGGEAGAGSTQANVRLNPDIGCVVIAVGDFRRRAGSWVLPFELPAEKKATALEDLKSKLGLYSAPILLFEAAFRTSADKTAVAWRPRRIYVGSFLNSSVWAGKSRSLQIAFGIARPGSDKSIYTQEFKFEGVSEGFSRFDSELDGGVQGAWGVLPVNAKDKPPGKIGRDTPLDPFTLTVQIVEAPKPYKLAQAFVDSVDANKAAIKTELAEHVDPAKKAAAEKTASAAVLTAKEGGISSVQAYVMAWKVASDSCATSNVGDDIGKLSCKLAVDTASVAKAKADAACGTTNVDACDAMSSLVLPPPVKP